MPHASCPPTVTVTQQGSSEDNVPVHKKEKNTDIEGQVWYHGYRPRKDVASLLKEQGDFLVRATEAHHKPEIIISVFDEKKGSVLNFTTALTADKKWTLGLYLKPDSPRKKPPPAFPTIVELVEHYKNCRLPGGNRLSRAIPRPKWLIKHDAVQFNKDTDLLGSGNFCHVYKGRYERSHGDVVTVAVKICHQGGGGLTDKETEEAIQAKKDMLHEAQLMSFYIHDHVIQLFGVACDHPPVLIVMEFCPGGNLEGHLKKNAGKIDTGERVVYCFEAARGMRYLHNKSCVHRDLAARNCLISSKGQIKIADFGLSKLIDEGGKDNDEDAGRMQVPIRWMAPETLKKPQIFSTKSDVWSFGVLIWEIFSDGAKPFPDDPPKKIATNIRKGKMMALPACMPPQLVKMLQSQLWQIDREKRPEFKEITIQLLEIHRAFKPPAKCTVNSLPGVKRERMTYEESMDIEQEESNNREKKKDKEENNSHHESVVDNYKSLLVPRKEMDKEKKEEEKEEKKEDKKEEKQEEKKEKEEEKKEKKEEKKEEKKKEKKDVSKDRTRKSVHAPAKKG